MGAAGGQQRGYRLRDLGVVYKGIGQGDTVILLEPTGTVKNIVCNDIADLTGNTVIGADLVPGAPGFGVFTDLPVHNVDRIIEVLRLNVGKDLL